LDGTIGGRESATAASDARSRAHAPDARAEGVGAGTGIGVAQLARRQLVDAGAVVRADDGAQLVSTCYGAKGGPPAARFRAVAAHNRGLRVGRDSLR